MRLIQNESHSKEFSSPVQTSTEEAAPPAPFIFNEPQSPLTDVEMWDLHKSLSCNKLSEQEAGNAQLESLSAGELTRFLGFERRLRKRNLKRMAAMFVALYVIYTALAILLKMPMLMIMSGGFVGIIGAVVAYRNSYKKPLVVLSRLNSVESVGELLLGLHVNDREVQTSVRAALTEILPQLKASDSTRLDEQMRNTLLNTVSGRLNNGRVGAAADVPEEKAFTLAILKALEQVGDQRYIPIVEVWAEGHVRGIDPQIAEASRECLPYLRQSADRREQSGELVRASDVSYQESAETLVRPALEAAETHAEELLRSADGDQAE